MSNSTPLEKSVEELEDRLIEALNAFINVKRAMKIEKAKSGKLVVLKVKGGT